ncbi:uncharacterized protein LOC130979549 [Arachis stenosperma]|uniref:uncharacterized protein LOC130979549 n=1 Tax=Arachis stenosperma TaxID=217475 RepID=UPI0025ABF1AC|nr:uncharacterized protein LOC130979549 [Arachis stenosperma]
MKFNTPKEAKGFDNNYRHIKGFTTRQGKKVTDIVKEIIRYTFVCNREGFREKKWLEKTDRKREHKVVTCCACVAEMRIKRKDGSEMCQYDYGVIGDVLEFDATYRRNKYNLPVVTDEFKVIWEAILDECGMRKVEWVQELYRKKYSWATAYIRGRFFVGIRTTSRCESLLAKLGRFVKSRTPILQTQFIELEKSSAT